MKQNRCRYCKRWLARPRKWCNREWCCNRAADKRGLPREAMRLTGYDLYLMHRFDSFPKPHHPGYDNWMFNTRSALDEWIYKESILSDPYKATALVVLTQEVTP